MKVFRYLGLGALTLVVMVTIGSCAFLLLSPQFGGSVSPEQRETYAQTGHYQDGKFINLEPFELKFDCHSLWAMVVKIFNPPPDRQPPRDIKVDPVEPRSLAGSGDKVIWLGHSSFIVRLDGKTILLDPVFSKVPAPSPVLGFPRFNKKLPITLDQLPAIDAVLVSHDHYDHLDYPTIASLVAKTKKFLVPLGVGNHLRRWGVDAGRIVEMGWWQERQVLGIDFAFTPTQHMSGRRLGDQSATLWGSWVIRGQQQKLYFSGDGGYGGHFSKIGERFGPFDIALMESGQYDELWPDVHMTPEQSVQAAMDVKAKLMVPIHWGTFTLSNHPWSEPAKRATAAAHKNQIALSTPRMGEVILLGGDGYPNSRWWESYDL